MVPMMSKEANISGRKSNHSLRVTGASSLFMPVFQKMLFNNAQDIDQLKL